MLYPLSYGSQAASDLRLTLGQQVTVRQRRCLLAGGAEGDGRGGEFLRRHPSTARSGRFVPTVGLDHISGAIAKAQRVLDS